MNKKRACFIGQPNVGKSSLFNLLTKSHQHTGNWTGKTVDLTIGTVQNEDTLWEIVDLPGTYSLIGESEEEKLTSSYVYSLDYDVAVVVLDATNLERSLVLLLEVLEVTDDVLVCLNLYDEAVKRNLRLDVDYLQKELGVKVILTSAKEKVGIDEFLRQLNHHQPRRGVKMVFDDKIERYIDFCQSSLSTTKNPRAVAMKLLIDDELLLEAKEEDVSKLRKQLSFFRKMISKSDITESFIARGKEISAKAISREGEKKKRFDERLDKLLTNKWSGIPCMLGMLFFLLWITISLSNIPSEWLFSFFRFLEPKLYALFSFLPTWIVDPLIYGGYRTLYWVVSVMTPPMAIFFPLFSLLEDYGLLPRIAFNLDRPFSKCGSCGKQCLTMCMGLGCNAVGVTGTRIMESRKMRVLSILTNVFMPCNGRFPAMISVISMFFISSTGVFSTLGASLILTGIILGGILLTFMVTKVCNCVLYQNEKTVFVLELPAYRRPKFFSTIYYALKDKAFDVLKRAMKVAFPAGLIIYLFANFSLGDASLMQILIDFFQPFGILLGVDGVILLAFLLGLPANEIVIPIMLLGYSGGHFLMEYESLESLKLILVQHQWTLLTAVNFLILCLCHFPCATTLLTIKEETKSYKLTALAFLLPTFIGFFLCFLTTIFFH